MKLRKMIIGALIAALYATLTILLAPISFPAVQFRVAEALGILPVFTPVAIPALFLGCYVSNIINMNIIDIVFGSLATLLSAYLTRKLRGNIFLAVLPPIFINGIIVGFYIGYPTGSIETILLFMASVAAGQAGVLFILGIPLYYLLKPIMPKLLNGQRFL